MILFEAQGITSNFLGFVFQSAVKIFKSNRQHIGFELIISFTLSFRPKSLKEKKTVKSYFVCEEAEAADPIESRFGRASSTDCFLVIMYLKPSYTDHDMAVAGI